MIEIISRGDLFASGADALVNTVNCVGIAGKGIALQFKYRFPMNHILYEQACHEGRVRLGQMFVTAFDAPSYIVNFPTKYHWRNRSTPSGIAAGLKALVSEIERRGIESIAIPALGCNNGGLDWRVVRPMIEKACAEIPEVRVMLYEPLEGLR